MLSEDEAIGSLCVNSVVVDPTVVMPACPHRLRVQLEAWGFDIVIVDVSEFHNGDGSIRRLTSPADITIGRDLVAVVGVRSSWPRSPDAGSTSSSVARSAQSSRATAALGTRAACGLVSLCLVFPIGGVEVMILGAVASGIVCGLLALAIRGRFGVVTAAAVAGLLWSLVVIALITLLPANGAPGVVYAEGRLDTCSWDIGGPAPDGFWIFSGGQRLLNAAVFVPSGALLVVAGARWRSAWVTVPAGLVLLAAYSIGIEATQLELARLDRACDVTDVIDNATGAAIGVAVGIVLAAVLRPWRDRRRTRY